MGEILHQLAQLFVQTIPTVILVFVLMVTLDRLLFRPLIAVLKERQDASTGALERARQAAAAAEAKARAYEAAFQAARQEVYRQREAARREVLAERENILKRTRDEADALVKSAQATLKAETEAAKQQLQATVSGLALEVTAADPGRGRARKPGRSRTLKLSVFHPRTLPALLGLLALLGAVSGQQSAVGSPQSAVRTRRSSAYCFGRLVPSAYCLRPTAALLTGRLGASKLPHSGKQGGEAEGESPHALLYKIINFLILAGALGYLLRKPLSDFFRQRAQTITESLQQGRHALRRCPGPTERSRGEARQSRRRNSCL